MHHFLTSDFLPKWSKLTADQIEPSISHALEEAKANIETIASQSATAATYESTFYALEHASESLDRGWELLHHLDAVVDHPEQREAFNKMLPDVSDFYSSLSLNPCLWNILKAAAENSEAVSLTAIQKRHVEETLEDFKSSGADLPEDQKKRVSEIDAELSKLTKQYGENVLDSTNAWSLVIDDETKIDGLPDSAKAAAAANARSKDLPDGSFRFTLQSTSMFPIMQHAHDESLRKTVWDASVNIACQEPHDNSTLVWKILKLRQQKAAILGFKNFADLVLQRRMARNGSTALSFVEQMHDKVESAFIEENHQLAAYKAEKTGTEPAPLKPWEFSYYAEMQRKEKFDIDDEALRPYFPVDSVMNGMFEIASKAFGITIIQHHTVQQNPDSEIETWHPEASFYEIQDTASKQHLGSFYTDWHPRETKRGGAWMNPLKITAYGSGKPHLALMAGNMTPPVGDTPALFTHREVETVFHEFGHLLHALLSEVTVKSLGGTNVSWDFVELPSQLLENYCSERETLDMFAKHYQTGVIIPEELFQKLIRAKNYMAGTTFMRQLALGKIDLELHLNLDKYIDRDLGEVDDEILSDYRIKSNIKSPSMVHRFNHLFSSPVGYAAGYYSYKWSEVLDADAFTRFKKEGILNPQTGISFRKEILSKGNSAPPEALYENFMSRPADSEALLVRAGLA
jgi:oligopeptidase A